MKYLILFIFIALSLSFYGCGSTELEKGESLYKAGNYADAIKHFKKVSSDKEEMKLYYIALSYHKSGDFKQAIDFYDRLINLKNKSKGLKKILDTIINMKDKALISEGMRLGSEKKLNEAYECFSKLKKNDYPKMYFMGIIERMNGNFIKSIASFKNSFNISNWRDNTAFICDLHWQMAKTFHEKFKKTEKIMDYYNYVNEMRMAFFLRHPDKNKWKQLATEYSLMQSDPFFIKNYGALNDAYNRIGRGRIDGNTNEVEENATYLINNSPLDSDIIYGYTSLCKLYLDKLNKPYKALEYYKKAKTFLEGKEDSIPLRMVMGIGEKIRKKIEEEKKKNE